MLTNVLGFLAEYFHRYLSYFHLIKDDKSRSISNKGVTSRKGFQFIRVKVKKITVFSTKSNFWYQFGVYLLQLHSTTLHENWDPFSCPSGFTFLRALHVSM